jgi:K+-sensing histidine kinase KdpD
MAILSWIVFTVAIGFIKPPPHSCWREMNSTHQIIERVGYSTSTITSNTKLIVKRQTIKISPTTTSINKIIDRQNRTRSSTSRRRKTTTLAPKVLQEDDSIDSSEEDNPINENNQVTSMNFLPINKPKNTMGNPLSITHTNLSLVKPLASPILYEKKDVRNVFMVFLLLIIVGEFFSAPAITLAVSFYLSLHC